MSIEIKRANFEDTLLLEMKSLYPIAQHILKQTGGNDHGDAWRAAILRERKLCGKDSCRDAAAVLVRHFAFNFSTSSVERLLLASNKIHIPIKLHGPIMNILAKVFQICLDEWYATW